MPPSMATMATASWQELCLANKYKKFLIEDNSKRQMKQKRNCFQLRSSAETLAVNALDLTLPASDALLKNRKNCWVQLSGHPGSFAPAGPNTIWKKKLGKDNSETLAYKLLTNDITRDVIPKFFREVEYNDNLYIEMEDLLQHFTDPFIMDIKMGTRTFLESEVSNTTLRKDLYDKMVKMNPSEPTPEEFERKAITKLRYMQFREKGSSSSTLGFRIEAIRVPGEPDVPNLNKVKTKEQVTDILAKFLDGNAVVRTKFLKRCQEIRRKFEKSEFFKKHMEVIGSSLLLLFDRSNEANVWMIDFAKTRLLDKSTTITHRAQWELGNHEDGYLTGLDNLIQILSRPDVMKKANPDATLITPLRTLTLETPRDKAAVTHHKSTKPETPHGKASGTHYKSTTPETPRDKAAGTCHKTLASPRENGALTNHRSTTAETPHDKPALTGVHNSVICTVRDSRHKDISVT